MAIEAFDISFGDDELAELRSRLLKARMPLPSGDAGTVGFEPSRLSELVARWATSASSSAASVSVRTLPKPTAAFRGSATADDHAPSSPRHRGIRE